MSAKESGQGDQHGLHIGDTGHILPYCLTCKRAQTAILAEEIVQGREQPVDVGICVEPLVALV